MVEAAADSNQPDLNDLLLKVAAIIESSADLSSAWWARERIIRDRVIRRW